MNFNWIYNSEFLKNHLKMKGKDEYEKFKEDKKKFVR